MRAVIGEVESHESDVTPKADGVASHMQWIVLHLTFQDPELTGWEAAQDSNAFVPAAGRIAKRAFEDVRQDVIKHHMGEYLASLSKNLEKCSNLVNRIRGVGSAEKPKKDPQGSLFPPDPPQAK
jgi:hypothetical protein